METQVQFNSRCLRKAAYNPDTQQLTLWFKNNSKLYTFYRVPVKVFQGLITASSAGGYYQRHIRGRYCR